MTDSSNALTRGDRISVALEPMATFFMRGLGYIMQYPVFGVGINQFSRAEGTIGPLAVNHVAGTALRFMAPHNTPLQVAADLGLPALLIWLSIPLMGMFWMPFQRSRFARGSPDPEERFLYQACTYMPAASISRSTIWCARARCATPARRSIPT